MEEQVTIKGLRLNYRFAGTPGGRPVIIMHGWGCRAETMALFEDCITSTYPECAVYNLDLPGFGMSEEPDKVYGIEDYTDTIERFADSIGLDAPVLIGHSFGGRIAILYSSRRHVSGVILVDAAGVKPRRKLKYYIKVYSFKAAKKIAPLIFGKAKGAEIIERRRGKSGSADYAAASPMMRAILSKVVNEDLRHAMPAIKAPTLLIWGENDTATPLSDARIMESLIPDAGLVSFPGCGHFSFLDNPVQTRAVVSSFINSLNKKQS